MQFPGSLHNHSEYSNIRLRDSTNKLSDLMWYAAKIGHNVLGITEHDCLSGHVKVEKIAKQIKEQYPDFKVIRGNEIYLCRNGLNAETYTSGDQYYHFCLYARDAEGHKQLRELSTRAWMRSYVSRHLRRVPTYYSDLEEVVGVNKGHIIASTACLGSYIGQQLLKYQKSEDKAIHDDIIAWCKYLRNLFDGEFYLELQPSANEEQVYVNKSLLDISSALDIPYIITTDSHYLNKDKRPIHKAYLNSQDGDREVDDFYATTYMMETEELESFLPYMTREGLDYAYQNIQAIADKCEDYSILKHLRIPNLQWKIPSLQTIPSKYFDLMPNLKLFTDSDFEGDNLLARAIVQKLEAEPSLQTDKMFTEVNDELKTTWISSEVNNAHWSAYFLNLQGIIDTCWEAGSIVGPGRGSGVGFVLLFLLDITQINPLEESTPTYAWRFLNPDRVSVLDVDFDVSGLKRQKILQAFRNKYGQDRVANVITFGKEKSRAALQTAARGLGIDNDEAQYLSSFIVADRGNTRTLAQCYYGDEEAGYEPIAEFVKLMDGPYKELWEVAKEIEGLICKTGIHAGGVIFVDEPFVNSTALMRAPDGTIVTQFDLHDAEDVGLIKYDTLSVEAEDKIQTTLSLLQEQDYINKDLDLDLAYEQTIGVYNLERKDPKMWEMIWNHQILSLFQMEKQSGIQGIALVHPESVDDLAVLNSVIRLMAQEKGGEQPLNKFARFKNDISLWYKEMRDYGLTENEIKILEPVLKSSYGICESQEKFMQLTQLPECGGFDLTWADRLRKSIAKKNSAEYDQLTKEYFAAVEEKGLSKNLCNYVWNVLVATSRGYGFNASHTLAYSIVALQEMNLAYKYPIIFWNCANLIVDSGGEEDSGKGTDYAKLARAIGKIRDAGTEVSLVDINNSSLGFRPDVEKNLIRFGLKGVARINDECVKTIIDNRPYYSIPDFMAKTNLNKTQMISLIKGGAFNEFCSQQEAMVQYLWLECDKKKRLTLQNLPGLIKYNLVPNEEKFKMPLRVYNFNNFLKKYSNYHLNSAAVDFLTELEQEQLIKVSGNQLTIDAKAWDKVYQKYMDVFRNWIAEDKESLLNRLNEAIFMEEWNKYAVGSVSAWEMDALCFYYHEHELAHVDMRKYGLVNFSALSEVPQVEKTFRKGNSVIPIYKLHLICGTCIAKDKDHGNVTLLTTDGVVTVRFRKEYFSMFDKQISQKGPDGKKVIIEKSWFNRGQLIMVRGIRRDSEFVAKNYKSTGGHTLYHIDEVYADGRLAVRSERRQGDMEDEDSSDMR